MQWILYKFRDVSLLLIKADWILGKCCQWLKKSPWPMVTESGTFVRNPFFFTLPEDLNERPHARGVIIISSCYPSVNLVIFIRIQKFYNLLVILFQKKFNFLMCRPTQPWLPHCYELLVFHLCTVNKPKYEYIEQIIWLA